MESKKRRKLQEAGWKVETVEEFLGLSAAESEYIEVRLSLSRLLKACRERRALTQIQVARVIGSSQSRVAKMESADPSVSLDLLIKSVLALGANSKDIARVLSKRSQKAAA